jgi:UDP-N-acetyl-2-amino-2-deoxyglucuronate dehydrogenase
MANVVTTPCRIAIIGCGWASSVHAEGYLANPELFTVTLCCDTDENQARLRAAQFPGCRIETEWQSVVSAPDVDAVDICLPHHLHAPVAIAAAQSGKHILIEKPLARTLVEGREMVDAAEEANVALMVAFNERYTWYGQTVRQLVDDGRLGDVYMVRTDHNQDTRFGDDAWYRSVDQVGGGALIGSGIHMLDLLRWFGGEPREVFCALHTIPERLSAEIAAMVTVKYADGGIGSLDISWAAPAEPWYQFLIVYGTEGRITTTGRDVVLATGGETEVFHPPEDEPENGSFVREILHFGECLRDGNPPITSGSDALRTQELLAGAYRSAEWNVPVSLPLDEKVAR